MHAELVDFDVMDAKELVEKFIAIYEANANQADAIAMSAYMKNKFEYFGIKKPLRKEISTPLLKYASNLSYSELYILTLQLWQSPQRELQYLAMEILEKSKFWKQPDAIVLIEKMLIDKSWWDTVDAIASKFVGSWFLAFPDKRDYYLDKWMQSDNMWLQRTCILFQLKYHEKTDIEILKACILPMLESNEFFIQKAIGWSLRQLAKTHPQAVLEIVNTHSLKPLSRREALKHLSDSQNAFRQ